MKEFEDIELVVDEPTNESSSIIKVIGVGGGGGNAVNQMVKSGIRGVDFVVCNTDIQALNASPAPKKIQIGKRLTQGLGAGNDPDEGEKAAIENIEEIKQCFDENTKMVFITAGMGGGTGTGAAPQVAKCAKERGILTIGVVTVPFTTEGEKRINQANRGIERMRENVDALLVLQNDKLLNARDEKMSVAFKKINDVVEIATRGIAELITISGNVNVDFKDVESVMKNSGVALMGYAKVSGQTRAIDAIKAALDSPLLCDNNIEGAKHVLINLMSSTENEITMGEFDDITKFVQQKAGIKANVIHGSGICEDLGEELSVTIIATGFGYNKTPIVFDPDVIKNGEKLEGLENEIITPSDVAANMSYVADLDEINKDDVLTSLENESAFDRKKRLENNN